ncbi:MAG: hypothetical protein D6778_09885, partial [Nitrospirae bacterium]
GFTHLKKAKTIPTELLRYLSRGTFIWAEVESPPGPGTLKHMHQAIKTFVRNLKQTLQQLRELIEKYRTYSVFRFLRIDESVLGRAEVLLSSFRARMDEQEAVTTMLNYLKESPELEREFSYLQRLRDLLREEFPEISRIYVYITHPSLQRTPELEVLREELIEAIMGYLSGSEGSFSEITNKWERFHEAYLEAYQQRHELYYSSEVFALKDSILSRAETELLRRISTTVDCITFEDDWWTLNSLLGGLPSSCRFNLKQELELSPLCRCNFQFNSPVPEVPRGLEDLPLRGIRNFLKLLREPPYSEKIHAYGMGIKDEAIKKTLTELIEGKIQEQDIEQLANILGPDILHHLKRALQGHWKIKKLYIEDLVDRIRGRRMSLEELKKEFLNWAGTEEETILHIRSRQPGHMELLRERLQEYGVDPEETFTHAEVY